MGFAFKSAWIIFLLLNINVPLSVKEGGKLGLVHVFPTLFTAAGGLKQMPAPNTLLNQACAEPRCYPDPGWNAGCKTNRGVYQICSSRLCLPHPCPSFPTQRPTPPTFPTQRVHPALGKTALSWHSSPLQNSSCMKGDLFFKPVIFFPPMTLSTWLAQDQYVCGQNVMGRMIYQCQREAGLCSMWFSSP